jgi:hypothetical protein
MMSVNASAQNLGEVVYQGTINTTLSKSLLYHFIGKVGSAFDTAMALVSARAGTGTGTSASFATAPTPGTFQINLVNRDGTVVTAHSDALDATAFNLVTVGTHRGLVNTAAFFISSVLAGRFTGDFIGYGVITHSFDVGTGVANVIDFTGAGFNIGYVPAQFDRTATTPTVNTKGEN